MTSVRASQIFFQMTQSRKAGAQSAGLDAHLSLSVRRLFTQKNLRQIVELEIWWYNQKNYRL